MALAQAAEKNKHCCHTPWAMFCGSSFVLAEILSGRGSKDQIDSLKLGKNNLLTRGNRSVKSKSVILEDIRPKFPQFHNPASFRGMIPKQQYVSTHAILCHAATASDL